MDRTRQNSSSVIRPWNLHFEAPRDHRTRLPVPPALLAPVEPSIFNEAPRISFPHPSPYASHRSIPFLGADPGFREPDKCLNKIRTRLDVTPTIILAIAERQDRPRLVQKFRLQNFLYEHGR